MENYSYLRECENLGHLSGYQSKNRMKCGLTKIFPDYFT